MQQALSSLDGGTRFPIVSAYVFNSITDGSVSSSYRSSQFRCGCVAALQPRLASVCVSSASPPPRRRHRARAAVTAPCLAALQLSAAPSTPGSGFKPPEVLPVEKKALQSAQQRKQLSSASSSSDSCGGRALRGRVALNLNFALKTQNVCDLNFCRHAARAQSGSLVKTCHETALPTGYWFRERTTGRVKRPPRHGANTGRMTRITCQRCPVTMIPCMVVREYEHNRNVTYMVLSARDRLTSTIVEAR